jgi:hypothetical protein
VSGVDVAAARSGRRHESRPGRRALVIPDLAELRGPTSGVVELSHRLVWQAAPLRRFDLDDPYDLWTVYETVLREAIRYDELRRWLDGPTLIRLWPELILPRGVRAAWEERFPALCRETPVA